MDFSSSSCCSCCSCSSSNVSFFLQGHRVIRQRNEKGWPSFSDNRILSFSLVLKVLQGERPSISSRMPPLLTPLISSCWETNPELRPSSDQVVLKLEEALMDFNKERQEEEGERRGGGEERVYLSLETLKLRADSPPSPPPRKYFSVILASPSPLS
jgi:hypothetical protein